MQGHTSSIHSLSFSHESSSLISGGADCTVRVWDVANASTEASSVTAVSTAGAGAKRKDRGEALQQDALVCTLPTKRTPVLTTAVTPRNLVLAAGPMM